MNINTISIGLRVFVNCAVFAFFVFSPMESRQRYNNFKTKMLVTLLIVITVLVTVFFLTTGAFLYKYSTFGILLWLCSAYIILCMTIKSSHLEILFTVLVILNLYVNIATIAKVAAENVNSEIPFHVLYTAFSIGVLLIYIPLLWELFFKRYKKIIEFQVDFTFWKFIWLIPALSYLMFYVRFINDYWRSPVPLRVRDIIFTILWALATYMFFWVTLQMIIQTYKGRDADEQRRLVTTQLRLQENQSQRLLENIENTARIRHDWRHHLLLINGFSESGDLDGLQSYLKNLIPEYTNTGEGTICQNHVVDVILRHYMGIAKAQGISVKMNVDIMQTTRISDTDLCIIFGNLIENAVEACQKQENGARFIKIKTETKGRQLLLMVENTYETKAVVIDDVYYSTKHEGVGIGLPSVKRVVEKYEGFMKIECRDDYFRVNVLLFNANEEATEE